MQPHNRIGILEDVYSQYRAIGIMEIYDDSSKDTAGDEEGIH